MNAQFFFPPLRLAALRIVLSPIALLLAGGHAISAPATAVSAGWQKKVESITWVAYTSPDANASKNLDASREAVQQDLAALRKAGFSGLVTYGANGDLPDLATAAGFKGLIMGLWALNNSNELAVAKSAAKHPIVVGYCVGNEGYPKRYNLQELAIAIQNVRELTGKPVTTTEEIDDYSNEELLKLGDWVFPNAHPYFHGRLDWKEAVKWTVDTYSDLKGRTDKFVFFKEVGLPTAGRKAGELSEERQEQYYVELAKTKVRFVYFEAFDIPWKDHLPIEPHWGIFLSNRTPKRLGWRLMGKEPPSKTSTGRKVPGASAFYIYTDASSEANHFKPTGNVGDCGDITINEGWEENPHSGKSCIRIVYAAKGKGPNQCGYPGPCKWAGTHWQEPPNNWGTESRLNGKGFDLTGYEKLTFWARADKDCKIEFKVGGIDNAYGDSLSEPRSAVFKLTREWKEFEISLNNADLRHIIGGFGWFSNWNTNPDGATFYLDEIRFVKGKK